MRWIAAGEVGKAGEMAPIKRQERQSVAFLLQVDPAFHLHDDKSGFPEKNVALRYGKFTLPLNLSAAPR